MRYEPNIRCLDRAHSLDVRWGNGLLLRSTNWLGDVLMTLPAAYQLSLHLPSGCQYVVLAPKGLAPIWRSCPWVDTVIPMQDKRPSQEEIRAIRSASLGVGMVFPNSFGSAWDIWRCGVPQRIGRKGRFRSFFLTDTIPEWPRSSGTAAFHQLSYYLELVSTTGPVTPTTHYPALKIDTELARKHGVSPDEKWLALAPGAAYGPAKQWPAAYFLQIAQAASTQGWRILLVGTAKEAETTAFITSHIPNALDLAGKTSLDELMALLKCSHCVIANDSGTMHLAAALGTRGVAIFGSTDPIATGPIGAPWNFLASTEKCRPCFRRECPRVDAPYACLQGISPADVLNEMNLLFH